MDGLETSVKNQFNLKIQIKRWLLILGIVYLNIFCLLTSLGALAGVSPEAIANGFPQRNLPAKSYITMTAKRLKTARVVWVNFEAFRKMGVEVPAEGLTPAFEKWLLDEFAYIVPEGNESKVSDKSKEFYSDRYGGGGMNGNLGSGRAASVGQVQIKGIGPTPNIGPQVEDLAHSTGDVRLREGLIESIWSVLAHRELPYGANENLLLIDTGINASVLGAQIIPRLLTVRQDPLRPAHFMKNLHAEGENLKVDESRAAEAVRLLPKLLPLPENKSYLNEKEQLREGLREFIRRIADQYAFSYVHRIHHGATTPSNIELDGKALDFCTQTCLSGYQKIKGWDFGFFGDPSVIENELLFRIFDDWGNNFPESWREWVPSRAEISTILRNRYFTQVNLEFLKLTGVPLEILDLLRETSEAQELGELLKVMADAGNNRVSVGKLVLPANGGTFELGRILRASALDPFQSAALFENTESMISDHEIQNRFVVTYLKFMDRVRVSSRERGIKELHLRQYIREATKIRTKDRPQLYRGALQIGKFIGILTRFRLVGNQRNTQKEIDDLIFQNRITYKDSEPFSVVISESVQTAVGVSLRTVFDLIQGQYYRSYRVQPTKGNWNLLGSNYSQYQIRNLTLEIKSKSLEEPALIKPSLVKGGILEFKIPISTPHEDVEILKVVTPWRGTKSKFRSSVCQRVFQI